MGCPIKLLHTNHFILIKPLYRIKLIMKMSLRMMATHLLIFLLVLHVARSCSLEAEKKRIAKKEKDFKGLQERYRRGIKKESALIEKEIEKLRVDFEALRAYSSKVSGMSGINKEFGVMGIGVKLRKITPQITKLQSDINDAENKEEETPAELTTEFWTKKSSTEALNKFSNSEYSMENATYNPKQGVPALFEPNKEVTVGQVMRDLNLRGREHKKLSRRSERANRIKSGVEHQKRQYRVQKKRRSQDEKAYRTKRWMQPEPTRVRLARSTMKAADKALSFAEFSEEKDEEDRSRAFL